MRFVARGVAHLLSRWVTVPESLLALSPVQVRNFYASWPSVNISSHAFDEYLEKNKETLFPLEGIWQAGGYKLGTIRQAEKTFTAFILEGDSSFWSTGQIKAELTEVSTGLYRAFYYMKNHLPNILYLKLMGAELRDDKKGFSFTRFESNRSSTDNIISIYQHDPATMVMRIHAFWGTYRAYIDSVIAAHSTELSSTTNLIIDVSDNGGGSDFAWRSLLPFLYTKPVLIKQYETLCDEEIIQKTKDGFVGRELLSKEEETAYSAELDSCMNHLGDFYCPGECTDTLRFHRLEFPRTVAVIIGNNTASAAENFVLAAEQSSKVTLFGQPTAGIVDYGNVLWYDSPSGCRQFGIPSIRSARLPQRPLDNIGIQPQVFIPIDIVEKIEFVAEHMKKNQDR